MSRFFSINRGLYSTPSLAPVVEIPGFTSELLPSLCSAWISFSEMRTIGEESVEWSDGSESGVPSRFAGKFICIPEFSFLCLYSFCVLLKIGCSELVDSSLLGCH